MMRISNNNMKRNQSIYRWEYDNFMYGEMYIQKKDIITPMLLVVYNTNIIMIIDVVNFADTINSPTFP